MGLGWAKNLSTWSPTERRAATELICFAQRGVERKSRILTSVD